MNIVNKIFLFISVIIIQNICSQTSSIDVSWSLNKDEYLEGEAIFLNIKYINNGDKPDSIKGQFSSFQGYISVINEKGEEAKRRTDYVLDYIYIREPYIKVNARDTLIHTVALSYMGFVELENTSSSERYYYPKGKYNVQFGGKYILFNVISPEGNDKIVFNKMLKAKKIQAFPTGNQKDSVARKMEIYQDIYLNYPESPYAEEAFVLYHRYYGFDNVPLETLMAFVDKYHDSYYLGEVLFYVVRNLEKTLNNEEVSEFLSGLILRYSDKNAGIVAKKRLNYPEY